MARNSQPYIQQIFVARGKGMTEDQLERKLYMVRKRAEAEIAKSDIPEKGFFYMPSLSARTIVYKGLLLAPQIANFYPELSDPEVVSALCLVHQRFSHQHVSHLATGASVPLHRAQRRDQYGARQRELDARAAKRAGLAAVRRRYQEAVPHHSAGRQRFGGVRQRAGAAGACRAAALPHAMAMLIPEAWSKNEHMNPQKRAFYEYHASLMEPWDGPAAIAFTDGRVDRRHAGSQRPAPGALPGDARTIW